jgi:hypothetical protein
MISPTEEVAMPRRSIPRMRLVAFVVSAWLAAVPAAIAQQGADRAMDLYRRQLREKEARRRAMIDRLAAIPGAAPLPRPAPALRPAPGFIEVSGHIMIGGEVFNVNRGLTLEPILPQPAAEADPEDDAPPQPVGRGRGGNVVAEENFDRWLFEGVDTEEHRRAHLGRILSVRVDQASMTYRLTPAQAGKLRLAGRGDIKRFFDAAEERRRAFDRARTDVKAGVRSLQDLAPLIADFREGPFGSESIYSKTLVKILREGEGRRRLR